MTGLKRKTRRRVRTNRRVRTHGRVKMNKNLKKGKGKKTVRFNASDSKDRTFPYPLSKTKNKKSLSSDFKPSSNAISNEIALKIADFQHMNAQNTEQSDDEEEVGNFLLTILKKPKFRKYLAESSIKLYMLFRKFKKNTSITIINFIKILESNSNQAIINYAKEIENPSPSTN